MWFPAVRSAISIPPYSEAVAKFVDREWDYLDEPDSVDDIKLLNKVLKRGRGRFTLEELVAEVTRRHADSDGGTELDEEALRRDEYKALLAGREEDSDGAASDFVCLTVAVPAEVSGWLGGLRKVTRLREVRALYGFSRLAAVSGGPGTENLCVLSAEKVSWLPAIEVIGEGLFFTVDRGILSDWAARPFAAGRRRLLQEAAVRRAAAYRQQVVPEVDIAKVAVHTLAHILIDQLSLDAGYPAASLRERLFVDHTMAGVLIYTASSDSAGSLGGVAAQAAPDRFLHAITEGLQRLSWCSSDPVCVESRASGADGLNLAACHACVLVPETSCELNNTYLDRALLFGTHEKDGDDGLLRDLLAVL